jgi:hypothetical protein
MIVDHVNRHIAMRCLPANDQVLMRRGHDLLHQRASASSSPSLRIRHAHTVFIMTFFDSENACMPPVLEVRRTIVAPSNPANDRCPHGVSLQILPHRPE